MPLRDVGQRLEASEVPRERHIMADKYQGHIALADQLHQYCEKVIAVFAVKRGCGLVRNQKRWCIDQGPRNRHPLLLPHAEIGRRFDPVTLFNHQGAKQCACLVPPLRIAASRERAGQSDIVDRIEIRDEVEALENTANVVCPKLISLFGGHLIQALVQNRDVPSGTRQEPAHYMEQGSFASARGAVDQNAFATLDAPLPNIQQLPLAIIAVRKLDPCQLDSHE